MGGWAASGSVALLLCCGSPEPETHSKCVILPGKQDWVCEGLLGPSHRNHPLAKLGRSAPIPRPPNGTN